MRKNHKRSPGYFQRSIAGRVCPIMKVCPFMEKNPPVPNAVKMMADRNRKIMALFFYTSPGKFSQSPGKFFLRPREVGNSFFLHHSSFIIHHSIFPRFLASLFPAPQQWGYISYRLTMGYSLTFKTPSRLMIFSVMKRSISSKWLTATKSTRLNLPVV